MYDEATNDLVFAALRREEEAAHGDASPEQLLAAAERAILDRLRSEAGSEGDGNGNGNGVDNDDGGLFVDLPMTLQSSTFLKPLSKLPRFLDALERLIAAKRLYCHRIDVASGSGKCAPSPEIAAAKVKHVLKTTMVTQGELASQVNIKPSDVSEWILCNPSMPVARRAKITKLMEAWLSETENENALLEAPKRNDKGQHEVSDSLAYCWRLGVPSGAALAAQLLAWDEQDAADVRAEEVRGAEMAAEIKGFLRRVAERVPLERPHGHLPRIYTARVRR